MSGSADVWKAINSVWDSQNLDSPFKALANNSDYVVLNDTEAGAGQPMPYCVLVESPGATLERMSAKPGDTGKRETREYPFEFHVHARKLSTDARSQKQIAADLADEIMKVYGGHPTVSPQDLTLDNGDQLITQHQNDYGVRTGEEEHQWVISYLFRTDVPVAT